MRRFRILGVLCAAAALAALPKPPAPAAAQTRNYATKEDLSAVAVRTQDQIDVLKKQVAAVQMPPAPPAPSVDRNLADAFGDYKQYPAIAGPLLAAAKETYPDLAKFYEAVKAVGSADFETWVQKWVADNYPPPKS